MPQKLFKQITFSSLLTEAVVQFSTCLLCTQYTASAMLHTLAIYFLFFQKLPELSSHHYADTAHSRTKSGISYRRYHVVYGVRYIILYVSVLY